MYTYICVCAFVSVYVILGHYYEHMGLLMALNEMNLLEKGTSYELVKRTTQAQNKH